MIIEEIVAEDEELRRQHVVFEGFGGTETDVRF